MRVRPTFRSLRAVVGLAVMALWPAPAHAQNFNPAVTLSTGSVPTAVAVADFNRDGIADLAVANSTSGTLSIFLGTGLGGFGAATHYPVGSSPFNDHGLAIGDFDRDGSLDVAVTNYSAQTVSILLGNGSGALNTATPIALPSGPVAVATADLDGDGILDLAVALQGSGTVAVLIGTGTGTFGPPASHPVGQNPSEVGIADLDGDGTLDLAVSNTSSSTVSILLGNGTGGFGPATHFPAGYAPWRMAIGDVDGDNVPDIAVVNDSQGVAVLRGTGAAAFAPPVLYMAGSRAWAVALGDFNGDGSLDLAVPDTGSSHLSILRNSGTGNFGLPIDFPVGTSPNALAVADLNGDGALDVATVNSLYGGSNDVSVLLSRGPTTGDTTPPSIWCGVANPSWQTANVAIKCAAADSGSGLANPADASFFLSTTVGAGIEDPSAATATHLVCDLAGNCAIAGPVTGNKIDQKPPAITITVPVNAIYGLNSVHLASYACLDGGSGITSCIGTVANGTAIDTSSVGPHVFDVAATDAVGNTAKATVTYDVVAMDWTHFRSGGQRRGVQQNEYVLGPANVSGLHVSWTAPTGKPVTSSPAVAGGIAYVGSTDGRLYAFSVAGGATLWSVKIGSNVFSSPAVSSGRVFIGSDKGSVYAFDARTGASLWTFPTGGSVNTSPAVAGRTVYIASADQTLYALDTVTGHLVWSQHIGGPVLSSPTVDENRVYIGTWDLLAFDARAGTFLWSAGIPAKIRSTGAASGPLVFVGADDGVLYAVEASGSIRWKAPTGGPIVSSPAMDGTRVYVGSDDGHLYAFDRTTGGSIWSTSLGGMVEASPACANGVVYIGSNGVFNAVQASSGAVLWTHGVPGSKLASSPAVADETVYVGADDHNLYAFRR